MNKMGLVEAVQNKIGVSKTVAEDAVDTVFDTIMKTLTGGEEVSISGFGAFLVKKRAARMGINPRTKEKIHISETVTPKFRAGKVLKQAVK
ncbi:MAG: HU family DNA-binding protein [bacterium]|nr:HU family DNA-binding protein [bacterium]